jgi:hypothetical protein
MSKTGWRIKTLKKMTIIKLIGCQSKWRAWTKSDCPSLACYSKEEKKTFLEIDLVSRTQTINFDVSGFIFNSHHFGRRRLIEDNPELGLSWKFPPMTNKSDSNRRFSAAGFLKLCTVARVTRWGCEKNRPKCGPKTHLLSTRMHKPDRGKRWATCLVEKNCPEKLIHQCAKIRRVSSPRLQPDPEMLKGIFSQKN